MNIITIMTMINRMMVIVVVFLMTIIKLTNESMENFYYTMYLNKNNFIASHDQGVTLSFTNEYKGSTYTKDGWKTNFSQSLIWYKKRFKLILFKTQFNAGVH
jgi:hypothetical protein